MSSIKLKVLTLNCWGVFVPLACKKRKERIQEIGREVSKGAHDIVFLQEIWSQNDYQLLCQAICATMPYTHYFHGGIIGSGLCIFSKHLIMETSQFRFTLNGYAHQIFCGDWMGDKSVGLAKLIIQPSGIRVNAYTTHLHAQYSPENTYNSFDEHRCLQAFEVGKFVRDTSGCCDFVVIGGDFNVSPNQIGYKVIKSVANLEDSWKSQKNWARAQREEPTCERPDNSLGATNTHCPEGVRIDYIFHGQNSGTEVVCESCDLAMRQIPGLDFPYSDHEGVEATFNIFKPFKDGSPSETKVDKANYEALKHLLDGISLLEKGVEKIRIRRKLWLFFCLFLGFCLFAMVKYQNLQMMGLQLQRHNVLQQYERLCSEIQAHPNSSECEKKVLQLLQPDAAEADSFLGRRCDLCFCAVEVTKVVVVALLLFSLLHGLVVLTREVVSIKSVTGDMKKLSEYLKTTHQN